MLDLHSMKNTISAILINMKLLRVAFLAICLIGFATGIGQSTSDLSQNSTTEISLQNETISATVVTPVLQETFIVQSDAGPMMVKHFTDLNCEYLSFSEISGSDFTVENKENFTTQVIPDKSYISPTSTHQSYRLARDGIRTN